MRGPETIERPEEPLGYAPSVDGSDKAATLGRIPLIAFLVGVGLLICATADALARATVLESSAIYWAGVALFVVPTFARLAQPEPSKGERLTLVCLLGMAFYAMKLIRDSLLFTIPDESIHAYNAEQVIHTHHLFGIQPLQAISTDFPGLEGATSALMSLTGMSSFGAGATLIGVAKLVLMIGLFLLFCRISGSPRIAGLGGALYVANSNFLIFNSQYSYESLALPLLVVALVAVAERESESPSRFSRWAFPFGLLTAAIVATHHLSSYALVVILVAISLLYAVGLRVVRWPNPWPYALFTFTLAAVWLIAVADEVVDYLGPVFTEAIAGIWDTLTGQSGARALFESDSGDLAVGDATQTPLLGEILSIAGVLLLLIALPFGLWRLWKERGFQPWSIVLGVAAVGFFGTLALRFTTASWETGSRAGEFLFIGLAFVIAFAYLYFYSWVKEREPQRAWLGHAALSVAFGVVVIGGSIAGWPWDARLQEPIRVETDHGVIESEPLAAARWAGRSLPDGRFAASNADSRFLQAQGGVYTNAGGSPDIEDVLTTPGVESWQVPLMQELGLRYIVSDQRRRHGNTITGYGFSTTAAFGPPERLFHEDTTLKWENEVDRAARIYDSGLIVVHDLEARP